MTLRRRDFLRDTALTGIGMAAGAAVGGTSAARAATPEDWHVGLRSIRRESLNGRLRVRHGRLPDGLRGTLYRNGPARHAWGGRRYHHWFDADGMIQAFHLTDAGPRHEASFVQTHKHEAERAAGRFLYPTFGTRWHDMRRPASPDDANAANTNVVPHHGRLLALWEGGSAHALDPATLDTQGPVTWSAETESLPFSAHPSVEADGTMWNFGVSLSEARLILYEIAPDGRLRRAETVPLTKATPMLHDFATTRRHLVFLLPPLNFDINRYRDGASILDSHVWEPAMGMRALVVDKADLSRRRWFDLPAGFVFHFGGAWDDGESIRLDYDHYADPGVVTEFARDIMDGHLAARSGWATATTVRLDLRRGTAHADGFAGRSEFPRIHPGRVGARYRFRYGLDADDDADREHPFHNAVRSVDLETGAMARYSFGPHVITEEHVVVPKPDGTGEDAAWLLGTALDTAARRTRLTVFDAAAVGDGPVMEAELPYALPLGFHGNFKAAG